MIGRGKKEMCEILSLIVSRTGGSLQGGRK